MKAVEFDGEGIKKTIVFPELSKAEVDMYLKKVLNINDISNFNVIVSDSVYNSLNESLTSEIYIFKKDQLYDHTLLKKFSGFTNDEPYEIKIPDTIAISNSATIINHKDYFFITDYTFGNCVFISKHSEHKAFVINTQDLTTETNFSKITDDTICFYNFSKYRGDLKSANMDRMRLESSFGTKNKMVSFLMAPDIKVINNEATLSYKTGIIIFDSPKEYKILHIDEESLPENYVIYPGSYFEHKEEYYIQIINIDRTLDDQYVFGKFILDGEKLVFSKFPNYKLPAEYQPASNFKSLRKILAFESPYIFLQYSLSFYNTNNDQTYKLPLEPVNLDFNMANMNISTLKLKYEYKFIDAYVTEPTIKIISKDSEKYYISLIDRTDYSLIKKLEIAEFSKPPKAGICFYSNDKLYYLSMDNTIVVEEIKYKE